MKRLGGVHSVLYCAERPDGRVDVKHSFTVITVLERKDFCWEGGNKKRRWWILDGK
jgi:hypothetical protein